MEEITNSIAPIVDVFKRLGWEGFSRIVLNMGGMMLLVLSLMGRNGLAPGLRTPAFLIGVISLIDILSILEDGLTASREGMASFNPVGTDPQDFMVRPGDGPGRVYLEPRVPRVSGSRMIEVRGNPGNAVIYWPSGGVKLGAVNDKLKIDELRNMNEIREKALGCGVMTLDERGRGIALAENSCEYLLYREIQSGKGGPIGKVRVSGRKLTTDGNRDTAKVSSAI